MQARTAEARRKGKTKQATLESNFRAYGRGSPLWPKHMVRWRHQLPKLATSRFPGSRPHWRCAYTTGPHMLHHKIWKLLKKVNKNQHHEKCNHCNQNKWCPIIARVSTKIIYTVRHVYMTTMTVMLMWQTQRFILTVSLPTDLWPLTNRNTLSFCDPIHKNNITMLCTFNCKNRK